MTLLNSSSNTIWQFNGFYKVKIQPQYQVILQENFTPLQMLRVKNTNIFLKREDQSSVGSHKFRPLSYQAAHLLQNGLQQATISSSGNAAIALSQISAKYPLKSFIFISPKTPLAKKTQLNLANSTVIETEFAPRFSNYLAKKINIPQLRPSKDDNAIEGYKSLGFELMTQNTDIDAVFFCITSGASLLGTHAAWQQSGQKMPAFHCVFGEGKIAPHRLKAVKKVINQSGGQLWEVSETELKEAEQTLQNAEITTSIEGIKALAACQKALKFKQYQAPVVVLSGQAWQPLAEQNYQNHVLHVSTLTEMDELINKLKS